MRRRDDGGRRAPSLFRATSCNQLTPDHSLKTAYRAPAPIHQRIIVVERDCHPETSQRWPTPKMALAGNAVHRK